MPRKDNIHTWRKTGFIATVVIILAFPAYLLKENLADASERDGGSVAAYVGKETCVECHKVEYDLWTGSDHDLAMDHANDSTVLGDFNNVVFVKDDREHRFYRRDEKFLVWTDGPDGTMEEFEVKFVFGHYPLQQYLVPFEGGKLQTLALTWDSEKKQWYHMADAVYPGQDIPHTDWLHWTNLGQNWNGMCADCHSTNLKKGFNYQDWTFHTTWSEIDVSCEACHGPSSEHLKWANLPELARPQDRNYGLVVQTSNITSRRYVDLCARCHTRRSALKDYDFKWSDLLDHMIPELVREPMYFADGQILEEDYVFGSFTQSRMYMEGVQCNDCHNVHSGKLLLDGNALCLQCHRGDVYDTYDHHFHKYSGQGNLLAVDEFGVEQPVGSGAQCINCHMTGRYYMGVDFRRDHSFRIPRPDLSGELGTPNACNQCHANQTVAWARNSLAEWYGKKRRPHYGTTLARGHDGDMDGFAALASLAGDPLYPPLVRSTALSLIGENYPDSALSMLKQGLKDIESQIRYAAVRFYPINSMKEVNDLLPLVNDPVRAVRYEAAVRLSMVPREQLPRTKWKALDEALQEYKYAMQYSGDFAASRHNLGNYFQNTGNTDSAIVNYLAALRIDEQFYPAKMNLSILYNGMGQNEKAEMLLRDVVKNHPEVTEANYSLGLLLAEMQAYSEAAKYLEIAAQQIGGRPRIFYNLGLIYQFIGENENAEVNLKKCLDMDPGNFDFLLALADHYLKAGAGEKARPLAKKLMELYPESPTGSDLLRMIDEAD
jgi:predicted CXXCH cytochrome family protein